MYNLIVLCISFDGKKYMEQNFLKQDLQKTLIVSVIVLGFISVIYYFVNYQNFFIKISL